MNVDESYQSHTDNCFSEKRQESANRRHKDRRGEAVDRRLGLDRRRGPGKRRSDDRKAAEEGQMTDEQFEFIMAVDQYKKLNNRPFPTWTEVLEIIKALGYRKVAEPSALQKAPTAH
ncbi:MAG: hypothetical protein WCE45_10530 [Sedimentisphaerales bacterium]